MLNETSRIIVAILARQDRVLCHLFRLRSLQEDARQGRFSNSGLNLPDHRIRIGVAMGVHRSVSTQRQFAANGPELAIRGFGDDSDMDINCDIHP